MANNRIMSVRGQGRPAACLLTLVLTIPLISTSVHFGLQAFSWTKLRTRS
jgi:hypothetical protein